MHSRSLWWVGGKESGADSESAAGESQVRSFIYWRLFSSSFFDPTPITLLLITLNRLSINNWHEAFVAVHTFFCIWFIHAEMILVVQSARFDARAGRKLLRGWTREQLHKANQEDCRVSYFYITVGHFVFCDKLTFFFWNICLEW